MLGPLWVVEVDEHVFGSCSLVVECSDECDTILTLCFDLIGLIGLTGLTPPLIDLIDWIDHSLD